MTSNEIKNLSLEEKIGYFRSLLTNLDNSNEADILNVFRLVNSYNIFDEDFFSHRDSYISDISEFIDIKMALEKEIQEFSLILVKWYLSVLASCDVKADDEEETKVAIPMFIYGFFASATIPVMSALMNSVDRSAIDLTDLYRVRGAFTLLSRMFQSHSFVASCFEILSTK